jgi:hypothetical protein
MRQFLTPRLLEEINLALPALLLGADESLSAWSRPAEIPLQGPLIIDVR